MKLYDNLTTSKEIPGLDVSPVDDPKAVVVAPEEQARAFELWLRQVWIEKSKRLENMLSDDYEAEEEQVVPIRQL